MSLKNRAASYQDSYFSIDDILTSQERIPCKIDITIKRMGYLDIGSENEDLQANTKLEVPYWMAKALHGRNRHIITVEIPKHYKEGYREILMADPNVVNLHKLCPHYYDFGTKLLNFENPEGPAVAKCLLKAFQGRFRKIMDSAQNSFNIDTSKLTERLDDLERSLFKTGQGSLNSFQKWQAREAEKITTSTIVQTYRKRKRAAMEET